MDHFIRIVYFVVACGDWFDVVTTLHHSGGSEVIGYYKATRARLCCAFTAVKRISLFFSF